MRRRSSSVAVGLVMVLLGFLVVVQARSQAANDALSNLSTQELTELVANITARNGQLRDEVGALERQRDAVEAAVGRGDTSAGQVRADLQRIMAWSGKLAVTGPGVRVSVSGDLPGDAVELLLNELRNAGAEATSIGRIRVVPGVVVTGTGGSLVAAGVPLADPVELLAVGDPETLAGSLTRSGGLIAQLAAQYPDVVIEVAQAGRLEIPATDRDLAPVLGRPRL